MTRNLDARALYFDFLCGIVCDPQESKTYSGLLSSLHRHQFYSLVPNDDNRGEDGKRLRTIFEDEEGHNGLSLCLDDECSVLEMLIGLSFRMENELEDGPEEKTASECFWLLLDNLEISDLDDESYGKYTLVSEEIDEKILCFLERRYDRTGKGGLFPLNFASRDQRKVEIWYQMSEFLLENFDF